MKKSHNYSLVLPKAVAIFTLSILTTVAKAQDKGIDINIGTGHRDWYNKTHRLFYQNQTPLT